MEIINDIQSWKAIRKTLSGIIGFVPTMGVLHKGHASLIEQAKRENDFTVVSIFVNSLQFNDNSDYQNYPYALNADKEFLDGLEVNYLFLPDEQDMYPQKTKFIIETDHSHSNILEGKCRPNHFTGVLTIILKLLNCICAERAYFGEKDFQQYLLIKAMAENFFLNTEIIVCPTIREASGLPYSSRNILLSQGEKQLAERASQLIHQTNDQTISNIIEKLIKVGIDLEYLEIKDARVYSAIKINSIRLIDNFPIEEETVC